jgi:pheromone a factor receptor
MLLALFNMSLTIPLSMFSIYLNSHGIQLAPWISWENVHYNFSRVEFVPSVIWRSIPAFNTSVELTRWLFPVSAFLFFALFGFASEAQKQYRTLFRNCHKALVRKSASSKPSKITYLPRSGFFFVPFLLNRLLLIISL